MSAELRAREEVLAAVRGERDELGAQAGLVPGLQREVGFGASTRRCAGGSWMLRLP